MSTFYVEVVDPTATKKTKGKRVTANYGTKATPEVTKFDWQYRVVQSDEEGEHLATFTGPLTKAIKWIKAREGLKSHTPKPIMPGGLCEQPRLAPVLTPHEKLVALTQTVKEAL